MFCAGWYVRLVGLRAHGGILFVLCGYKRTPLDNCARHEGREAEALRQLLRSASEGCAIGV